MQPIQEITKNDKELIRQWCINYALAEPQSVEAILSYWNKNKKKLFRGFGNKLRISFPIHQKVNSTYRHNKWRNLYSPLMIWDINDIKEWKIDPRNHQFINSLGIWLKKYSDHINLFNIKTICEYTKYCYIENGKTYSEKIFNYENKKKLVIPAGTKIMRAIRKILEYHDFPYMDDFNKWRDDISVINTDKEINAELVFSIHPIDYITMSDNKSGWTSCMSWIDNGGYSTGTIEMMNSNMAIVAYLKNPKKFEYNGFEIPNKSWRTLVFVNKDIMIVGKHYPYQSEALAKIILDKLQIVLSETLGWKYQYKNQLYLDMINSYSNTYIRNDFCRFKYNDSHRIYTYMNVMYADMIEDHDTDYWCCRNYVPHNKYYNLSGPATCMCCGKRIAEDKDSDYSINSQSKYCDVCFSKYGCDHCNTVKLNRKYYYVPVKTRYTQSFMNLKIDEDCLLSNDYYYDIKMNWFVKKNYSSFPFQELDRERYKPVNKERIKKYEICSTVSTS